MVLTDTVQFLVTVEVNHGLKEVVRLRSRECDALYTAIKSAVNECYSDPQSPGQAGDWFADHLTAYYPEFVNGTLPEQRIEDNAEHEGSDGTIVFVTVYRLW